jgi:N-acetylmuramoyl-L-alanine amidase/putative methionine-R-sulfoxide reductase with GAF domain
MRPRGGDALQALLAFSALHQQIRRRRALASRSQGFEAVAPSEFEPAEHFVLDEVLQSVAERALAITGADGLGIALAENNEIVLRASAGTVKPAVGARIQRDSAFSGACFRMAQVIRCDDAEKDSRVNLEACRELGARSMVAVPLCGRTRVIGLLEAFSSDPFGFNDTDVNNLELLAELILAALKPEEEDRFALSAEVAAASLGGPDATPAADAQPETSLPNSDSSADSNNVVTNPASQLPNLDAVAPTAAAEPVQETALPIVTEIAPVTEPAESVAGLPGTALDAAVQETLAEPAAGEMEAATAPSRHTGLVVGLILLLVACLCAAGYWWKLKDTQFGSAISSSAEKLLARPLAAKTTTPIAVPAPALEKSAAAARQDSAPAPLADDADIPSDLSSSAPSTSETSKMAHINGIRHWSSTDSSTVVLDLQDQVQYEAHRLSNPDRIYFDLHDTTLAADISGKAIDIGDPLLARVRVAQPTHGLTRVVLETKLNPNYSVSMETNPCRLVVQLTRPGANPKSQIDLFPGTPAQQKVAIVVPPPTREDLQLRVHVPKMRIVVDAGHGGWDLGTVGKHGLLEKDVVLEIAQRLGKLLETRLGAEVILTRDDDIYVPLDERAGIANQAQADLFVSVHANYSDLPSARGVETYYTNFFSSPNAKDVETRQASGKKNVSAALSPADLHDRIEQSRRLAASVQRSLYGNLSLQNPGLRDRGVKEASYVVLTETAMPGILAEVSFVSSPADEQRLRTDGYREQIAEALFKGIARYAASSHSVKMASAAR